MKKWRIDHPYVGYKYWVPYEIAVKYEKENERLKDKLYGQDEHCDSCMHWVKTEPVFTCRGVFNFNRCLLGQMQYPQGYDYCKEWEVIE